MVVCEHCGAKLPDWATQCQFCNAVVNPTTVSRSLGKVGQAPDWVWGAYYAVSVWYILQGAGLVILSLLPAFSGHSVGLFQYVFVTIGALTALFGIGLLARVEIIRAITNFFCGIQILFGLLGLVNSVFSTLMFGPMGLLMMFMDVLQIATAAFMIYLIGETDRTAPNL